MSAELINTVIEDYRRWIRDCADPKEKKSLQAQLAYWEYEHTKV